MSSSGYMGGSPLRGHPSGRAIRQEGCAISRKKVKRIMCGGSGSIAITLAILHPAGFGQMATTEILDM